MNCWPLTSSVTRTLKPFFRTAIKSEPPITAVAMVAVSCCFRADLLALPLVVERTLIAVSAPSRSVLPCLGVTSTSSTGVAAAAVSPRCALLLGRPLARLLVRWVVGELTGDAGVWTILVACSRSLVDRLNGFCPEPSPSFFSLVDELRLLALPPIEDDRVAFMVLLLLGPISCCGRFAAWVLKTTVSIG